MRCFGSAETGIDLVYVILFQQSLGVTLSTIFLNDEDKANFFIDHGLGVNGWVYNIAKVIAPIFTFNFAYSKLHLIGSVKSFCRDFETKTNLTERCSERSKDFIFCCDSYCDTFICPKSRPLSLENAGIFVELILMMVSALIFWFLLIYLDRNYSQEQSSSSEEHKKFVDLQKDSDVIAEEVKVNRIIREERSKEEAMVVAELTKYYRTVLAVNRLSFAVHKNECFGLLGVNGAGKTTTFSMLTGEIKPNDGNAYIDGLDLKSKKKSYQKRIGYCPQTDPLLEFMTANEMLHLFGRLRGIPKQYLKTEIEAIIQTTDIEKYANTISEHYSGGTKRKLSLGISIIGSPELIFLDEPTAGVDPIARGRIWKALNVLKSSRDSSIILTSHSMEESEALCSQVAIMVRGEFKCFGSIQHLKTKYGKGFTLIVKLKTQYITDKKYIEKVKKFISERLPSAQLTDSHECLLHYKLSDTSVKWSTMFRVMQTGAKELNLEDYTLSDTTLEQIFISFARQK